MKKSTTAVLVLTTTFMAAPSVVEAGSWICENGNLVREIRVERETDNPAPCSVVYNKDSEGQGSTVLWAASFDGAYCDAKADGLADKLIGFGWTCIEF